MHSKVCPECATEFVTKDSRTRYCTQSCSARANNRGRTRHGVPSIACKGCSKLVRVRANRSGYCSTECRQADEIQRWLVGELDGRWKYTHAAYVRRYLEQRSEGACETCGYAQTRPDGSSILQVDHINGNWQDNRVENVRLLCPNCHALTDTWGAGNMGKGRKWKANYSQF